MCEKVRMRIVRVSLLAFLAHRERRKWDDCVKETGIRRRRFRSHPTRMVTLLIASFLGSYAIPQSVNPPAYAQSAPIPRQLDSQESIDLLYSQIMDQLEFIPGPHPDVLPEGVSIYFGEYICAQGLAGSVSVVYRSGGDITVIKLNGPPLSVKRSGSVGHHRAVGTYNPATNRFTEVPDERLVPKPGWVMGGRDGTYSGVTGQLIGSVRTAETFYTGKPLCKDFQLFRIAPNSGTTVLEEYGFKPPSTLGETAVTLPSGITKWSGKFFCTGNAYDMTLEILHEGEGTLSATFIYRESGTDRPQYAFLMSGTHNTDSGRFSLDPIGWIDEHPPSGSWHMYFVDGHHLRLPNRLLIRIITGTGPCYWDETVSLSPVSF